MKKISLSILSILMMFVLAACSMNKDTANEDLELIKDSEDLDKVYNIGLSISTLNNPFFVSLNDAAMEKAKELGAILTVYDALDNASKQANDVEDLIQQGTDLILINPVDSAAVASAVESANAAGIPVITVDRSSDGGEVLSHIASDNEAGGKLAGDFLVELLGEGANVAELEGVPGSSAARDRGEGFNSAVAGKLNVIAKQTGNFNRSEGLTVMENILQGNEDIVGVFAHNDEMALGAIEAIKASGKDIKVVGFDATDDAVKAVETGTLSATVAQKPDEIGRVAVETAVQHLKGEKVEKSIPVELELIKK